MVAGGVGAESSTPHLGPGPRPTDTVRPWPLPLRPPGARPSGCSRCTPIPTIPRSRARARWPGGPTKGPTCGWSCARGATRAPRDGAVDPDALVATRAAEADAAAAVLGLAGHENLGLADGEIENDLGAARRARRPGAAVPTGRGRVVRPHRRVLRQPVREPPRPPRGRLRAARRLHAGGWQPALLPRGGAGPPREHDLPVGDARTRHVRRHRLDHRPQGRGAVLPSQPGRRRPRPGRRGRPAPSRVGRFRLRPQPRRSLPGRCGFVDVRLLCIRSASLPAHAFGIRVSTSRAAPPWRAAPRADPSIAPAGVSSGRGRGGRGRWGGAGWSSTRPWPAGPAPRRWRRRWRR